MDIDPNFTINKSIVVLIITIIGIMGNVISFIIFSRKTFRKNPVSIYCSALALFDTSVIAFSALIDIYYILYDYYILNYSDFICAFLCFAYYTIGSIPGWILVAFSIDRTLSLKKVTNVMKRPIWHYMIIIGICLVHFLLYLEVPILVRRSPLEIYGSTAYVCDTTAFSFGQALNIVYSIQSSVIPFLIMIISSLITIKKLRDSSRSVEMLGSVADKRKSRDRKFAITSITFNVLFIVLKMPFLVSILIGYHVVSFYLYQISLDLFFFNYSISFFVHFFTNSIFRRELYILLRLRKPVVDSFAQTNQQKRLTTDKKSDLQSNLSERNNRHGAAILEVVSLDENNL